MLWKEEKRKRRHVGVIPFALALPYVDTDSGLATDFVDSLMLAHRLYKAASCNAQVIVHFSLLHEAQTYVILHEWIHDFARQYAERIWHKFRAGKSLSGTIRHSTLAQAVYTYATSPTPSHREAVIVAAMALAEDTDRALAQKTVRKKMQLRVLRRPGANRGIGPAQL